MLVPLSVLDNQRFSKWWFSNAATKTRALIPIVYSANIMPIDGGFEFEQTGESAAILPVTVAGDVIDLVAWKPKEPGTWWLRCGLGQFLGWDDVLAGETRMHATPMDWLYAGCVGGVKL